MDQASTAMVLAAAETAAEIQAEGNARWRRLLGDPGETGGFQVDAYLDDANQIRFVSVLFGGRTAVGTALRVRAHQRAYIDSRAKRRKAGA